MSCEYCKKENPSVTKALIDVSDGLNQETFANVVIRGNALIIEMTIQDVECYESSCIIRFCPLCGEELTPDA